MSFQELASSPLRNLGIGNQFNAVVTITVVNGATVPLTGYGVRIVLAVPTLRYPDTKVTADFQDINVPAGSHATLTTTGGTISTETGESPGSWSVGGGSDAGQYKLQVPSDYDYTSVCGVAYAQPFAVLN